MAWNLLTKVYNLPSERLYVTYYSGDKDKGLEPDLEAREIWLNLGIEPEKVLPFGNKENFWGKFIIFYYKKKWVIRVHVVHVVKFTLIE